MADKPRAPAMKNIAAAPMVYFDQAPLLGVMNNVVEIDLAARVSVPSPDGRVASEMICVAHLRGSIEAALSLRSAIDKALAMAGYRTRDDYVEGDPDEDPSPGRAFASRVGTTQ